MRVQYGTNQCGMVSCGEPAIASIPALVDDTAPTNAPIIATTLAPAITNYPTLSPTLRMVIGNGRHHCAPGNYSTLFNKKCLPCPVEYYCPDGYFGYPCKSSNNVGNSICYDTAYPSTTSTPSVSQTPTALPTQAPIGPPTIGNCAYGAYCSNAGSNKLLLGYYCNNNYCYRCPQVQWHR